MDDALLVRGFEGFGDLLGDGQGFVERDGTLADTVLQDWSFDQDLLHQIVRDHFETFRAEAAHLRNGDGLPGFVEREFREFLRCGALAAGFELQAGRRAATGTNATA